MLYDVLTLCAFNGVGGWDFIEIKTYSEELEMIHTGIIAIEFFVKIDVIEYSVNIVSLFAQEL